MPSGLQTFGPNGNIRLDTTASIPRVIYEYAATGAEDHSFTIAGIGTLLTQKKARVIVIEPGYTPDGVSPITVSGDTVTVKMYTSSFWTSIVTVWRWA